MILWSLQSEAAFHTLEQTGCLRTDKRLSFCNDIAVLEYAYRWISDQMRRRVSIPPNGVEYPIWAWYQRKGIHKRPDMRESGYAECGASIVLLTIDIPDRQVLLSDFNLFHYPLNGLYAAKTEEEYELFYMRCRKLGYEHRDLVDYNIQTRDIAMLRDEIQQSWDAVFDLTTPGDDYFFSEKRSIQAIFWELWLDQVVKAEHFRAR